MEEKTIPILTYHSVDNSHSPISVAPSRFMKQMRCLKKNGYQTLPKMSLTNDNLLDKVFRQGSTMKNLFSLLNSFTEAIKRHIPRPLRCDSLKYLTGGCVCLPWKSYRQALPDLHLPCLYFSFPCRV